VGADSVSVDVVELFSVAVGVGVSAPDGGLVGSRVWVGVSVSPSVGVFVASSVTDPVSAGPLGVSVPDGVFESDDVSVVVELSVLVAVVLSV
jgi:hypothetical protein